MKSSLALVLSLLKDLEQTGEKKPIRNARLVFVSPKLTFCSGSQTNTI